DVFAVAVRDVALAVTRRVRPGQADRVAGAVRLVEQQPAADVAGDGFQSVGVDGVAGAGANLAEGQDAGFALAGPLDEAGRLAALTLIRGLGLCSLGHWIDSLVELIPGPRVLTTPRGPTSFTCLFPPPPIARWLGRLFPLPGSSRGGVRGFACIAAELS